MARKVYITSEMSIDERLLNVAEEDQLAALIWPWILTAFDDWGRSEAKPKKLKAKIFPGNELVTAERIETALRLYDEHGLIKLYEVDNRPYMAISAEKWFKYQTQIRKVKREVDESKYPSPSLARECAQVREESRENIPSPSPSTLPPFTFNSINDDDKANAEKESTEDVDNPLDSVDKLIKTVDKPKEIGTTAVIYAEQAWGRMIPQGEAEAIIKWCDDFANLGSLDPDALVVEAIKRALDQNVRKLAYVSSILRNWFDNGVTKVEHLTELDERYKRAKEGKAREPNRGTSGKHEETQPRKSKYRIPTFIDGVEQPL